MFYPTAALFLGTKKTYIVYFHILYDFIWFKLKHKIRRMYTVGFQYALKNIVFYNWLACKVLLPVLSYGERLIYLKIKCRVPEQWREHNSAYLKVPRYPVSPGAVFIVRMVEKLLSLLYFFSFWICLDRLNFWWTCLLITTYSNLVTSMMHWLKHSGTELNWSLSQKPWICSHADSKCFI